MKKIVLMVMVVVMALSLSAVYAGGGSESDGDLSKNRLHRFMVRKIEAQDLPELQLDKNLIREIIKLQRGLKKLKEERPEQFEFEVYSDQISKNIDFVKSQDERLKVLFEKYENIKTVGDKRNPDDDKDKGLDEAIKNLGERKIIKDIQLVRTITGQGEGDYNSVVSLSPDGKYLASGSHDGDIKIWDMDQIKADGDIQPLKRFVGFNQTTINVIAFSPDGRYLAAGSGPGTPGLWSLDREIKIWDMDQVIINEKVEPLKTLAGHKGLIYSIVFSPDGKYLASGSGDNTIKIWDMDDIKKDKDREITPIKTLDGVDKLGFILLLSFSSDGKYLASGTVHGNNTISIWLMDQVIQYGDTKPIKTLVGHEGWATALSFSSDGKYLASGSTDKTIKIWDINEFQKEGYPKPLTTIVGHETCVSLVASPDVKYLFSVENDGFINVWDMDEFKKGGVIKPLNTQFGHKHSIVTSVTFTSNGKYLVWRSGNYTFEIWRITYLGED